MHSAKTSCLLLISLFLTASAHAGWFEKEYKCDSPEVREHYILGITALRSYGWTIEQAKRASPESIRDKCMEHQPISMVCPTSEFWCEALKWYCDQYAKTLRVEINAYENQKMYATGYDAHIKQYKCVMERYVSRDAAELAGKKNLFRDDLISLKSGRIPSNDARQASYALLVKGRTLEDWQGYLKWLEWQITMALLAKPSGFTEKIPFTVQPSSDKPGFLFIEGVD